MKNDREFSEAKKMVLEISDILGVTPSYAAVSRLAEDLTETDLNLGMDVLKSGKTPQDLDPADQIKMLDLLSGFN